MKSFSSCIALVALAATPVIGDDQPQLHPIEAACVQYEMSGQMQNGTSTRCHRQFAYEQFEIQDVSVGFGGFTQSQNQHNITIGNVIYAINLATNTGTKTVNPFYDQIVNSMQGMDADDVADAYFQAMGFSPTGASKTVADIDCNVYQSSMLGIVCMTEDGLMLEQSFMGNTTIATSVDIGNGGDDANYTLYQDVPITAGPDLSNMGDLQQMMQQMQQQPQQ